MKFTTFFYTALFFIIMCNVSTSQWSSDPSTNLAVCTINQAQRETRICTDEQSNAFIFWRDYRNETSLFGGDIYAQKLDVNGNALWESDGKAIINNSGGQFDPKVIRDKNNGTYLIWRTTQNLFQDYTLHANRINSDGNKLWGSSNITIQSGLGTTISPSICVNDSFDLLITWQLALTGIPNSVDIYCQKINPDGVANWNSNGLLICSTSGRSVVGSKIADDKNGGAYICWSDNRNNVSDFEIYAQHVRQNGTVSWTENGIPICTNTGAQNVIEIIPDNDGELMIFWEDIQETSYSIYAQRIDSTGNKLLDPEGKLVYVTTFPFSNIDFITDKNDEIFFLWSNSDKNIYAQKIDYNGNLIWSSETAICATQTSTSYLTAIKSNNNGVILSWLDNRNSNYDIFTQWITSEGITKWNANGVAICNNVSEQADYCISSDNYGGAVVAWADMRNGNFDIYAQNIDVRGKLGSNKSLFQNSGLNKIIGNSNVMADSIQLTLPPLDESGYYSLTALLDSIIHPAVNELTITLTHENISDTIVYELTSGQNFIHTYLDDYAEEFLSTESAPFTGMFKPFSTLSIFMQINLNGYWILEIKDNIGGNDGILKSWGLVFNKGDITNLEFNPETLLPNKFVLYQNYPNPFNPSTMISWQLPKAGNVEIILFNCLGEELEILVDEFQQAGLHSKFETFNSKFPSGVYFYQLRSGDYIQTKKMIYLK